MVTEQHDNPHESVTLEGLEVCFFEIKRLSHGDVRDVIREVNVLEIRARDMIDVLRENDVVKQCILTKIERNLNSTMKSLRSSQQHAGSTDCMRRYKHGHRDKIEVQSMIDRCKTLAKEIQAIDCEKESSIDIINDRIESLSKTLETDISTRPITILRHDVECLHNVLAHVLMQYRKHGFLDMVAHKSRLTRGFKFASNNFNPSNNAKSLLFHKKLPLRPYTDFAMLDGNIEFRFSSEHSKHDAASFSRSVRFSSARHCGVENESRLDNRNELPNKSEWIAKDAIFKSRARSVIISPLPHPHRIENVLPGPATYHPHDDIRFATNPRCIFPTSYSGRGGDSYVNDGVYSSLNPRNSRNQSNASTKRYKFGSRIVSHTLNSDLRRRVPLRKIERIPVSIVGRRSKSMSSFRLMAESEQTFIRPNSTIRMNRQQVCGIIHPHSVNESRCRFINSQSRRRRRSIQREYECTTNTRKSHRRRRVHDQGIVIVKGECSDRKYEKYALNNGLKHEKRDVDNRFYAMQNMDRIRKRSRIVKLNKRCDTLVSDEDAIRELGYTNPTMRMMMNDSIDGKTTRNNNLLNRKCNDDYADIGGLYDDDERLCLIPLHQSLNHVRIHSSMGVLYGERLHNELLLETALNLNTSTLRLNRDGYGWIRSRSTTMIQRPQYLPTLLQLRKNHQYHRHNSMVKSVYDDRHETNDLTFLGKHIVSSDTNRVKNMNKQRGGGHVKDDVEINCGGEYEYCMNNIQLKRQLCVGRRYSSTIESTDASSSFRECRSNIQKYDHHMLDGVYCNEDDDDDESSRLIYDMNRGSCKSLPWNRALTEYAAHTDVYDGLYHPNIRFAWNRSPEWMICTSERFNYKSNMLLQSRHDLFIDIHPMKSDAYLKTRHPTAIIGPQSIRDHDHESHRRVKSNHVVGSIASLIRSRHISQYPILLNDLSHIPYDSL